MPKPGWVKTTTMVDQRVSVDQNTIKEARESGTEIRVLQSIQVTAAGTPEEMIWKILQELPEPRFRNILDLIRTVALAHFPSQRQTAEFLAVSKDYFRPHLRRIEHKEVNDGKN